jgi:cytochrome c2
MTKVLETAGVGSVMVFAAYALFNVGALTAYLATAPGTVAAVASTSPVEVPDVSPSASAKPVSTVAQAAAMAATAANSPAEQGAFVPDPKAGESVFAKCKPCHTIEAEGKNGVGPNLYGVVNRSIGSHEGFQYSKAMTALSGQTWTPQFLDAYLSDVKATVKGTKMTFAGLPSSQDRANLIAFLASKSASPIAAADLGLAGAAAAVTAIAQADQAAAPSTSASEAPQEAPSAEKPAVTYSDPPPPTQEQIAKEVAAAEALKAAVANLDYERARHHPLHYKPAIDTASNAECLVCHQEVLDTKVRETSPAGVAAATSLAWYQTLATYDGEQLTFHQRHLVSPYAQSVMNLKCNFCHQGNDLREESPTMTLAPSDMTSNNGKEPFTNRKVVNPSETCLLCHGAMPDPVNIMGLPGPWHEARKDLETPETPNGCLTCHGELFRTNRHKVSYLNAATIEDLATESSDVCFGCHGGRSWYRISYPYPRHAWPNMDPAVPDWAKDRKVESDPRYALPATAQ